MPVHRLIWVCWGLNDLHVDEDGIRSVTFKVDAGVLAEVI